MKTVTKFNLVLVLCLGLIFPFGPSQFFVPVRVAAMEKSAGSSAKAIQPEIKVVALAGTAKITAIKTSLPSSPDKCLAVAPGSLNMVQDAGTLNLSQPAGCFNLQLGRLSVQSSLAVRPLAGQLPEVTVAHWPVMVSTPFLQPTLPNFQPYIPYAGIVLLLSILILMRGERKKQDNASAVRIYRRLTVFQLQAIRC